MFRHNLVSLDAIFREPRLTIISSQHISWLRALINCIKMLRFMLVCFSLLNFLVAQSNMMHKACPYETAAQYHLVIADWTVNVTLHCVSSVELYTIHMLHVFILFQSHYSLWTFVILEYCGYLFFYAPHNSK